MTLADRNRAAADVTLAVAWHARAHHDEEQTVNLVNVRHARKARGTTNRLRRRGWMLVLAALTPALALLAVAGGVGLPAVAGSDDTTEAPQTREFTLTAEEFDWEVMPGTTVRAWGYNRQVPGPEIRVREGDRVRITLQNRLPVGSTVHWHGVNLPPAMDGPAGLNQAPVEPGEDFTYEFVADPAGSRMYHSHTDVAAQVALGLYGPLVIEPKEPTREYDREATYMLSEWDLELTPDVAMGKAPRGPRDQTLSGGEWGTDLFLMNGRAGDGIPPLEIAEGERVLVRLMNMGSLAHPIHTHGHSFKVVATDGNPVPEGLELTKDTIMIAPGERYDIELTGDNPGVWMFHCHIESHAANGMMTLIAYEGEVPTGPLAELWDPGAAAGAGAAGHDAHGAGQRSVEGVAGSTDGTTHPSSSHAAAATATPAATAPAAPAVTEEPAAETAEPTPAADAPEVSGPTAAVAVRDDRFDPPSLEIAAGTTVVWTNEGANLHTIKSFDGGFEGGRLAPGESHAFRFDAPGVYRYVCTQHSRQGMVGTITVT